MKHLLKQKKGDTEAGMLLGISQKHNMCSRPCRLTEFCNSQCLSHFAAPFIVARTETSIAENCKWLLQVVVIKMQYKVRCAKAVAREAHRCIHRCAQPNAHEYCNGSSEWTSQADSTKESKKWFLNMCEWSFRRFTYGNLVTTSPSSKW